MSASPSRRAVQLRRRSAASPLIRSYSASISADGDRWSASDVIPCLGNEPIPWLTWQRPQIPRPPQTESMSTPSDRAASRTVVPSGNRPRLPDGVKMTRTSAVLGHEATAQPGTGVSAGDPLRRRLTRRPCSPSSRGQPEATDPAAALGIVAHQHVGGHDGVLHTLGDRVRDRRGQPAGDRHRQVGAVDPFAIGQTEADVRRPAGAVDLELVAQPAEDPEDLPAGRRHRPDRHEQRVDDDVLARDAVIGSALDDPLGHGEPDVGILGDPRLVVRDRDDRRAVLPDERQDLLEPLVLAGHRVDERLALVDGQAGLERGDDRRVDRQRESVSDWTSWIVRARIAGSSASGIPALTSSMWAPASTWATTSRSTRLKSPPSSPRPGAFDRSG